MTNHRPIIVATQVLNHTLTFAISSNFFGETLNGSSFLKTTQRTRVCVESLKSIFKTQVRSAHRVDTRAIVP